MSKGNLTEIISTAGEALNAFLATLLGDQATIQIDQPVRTALDEAAAKSASLVALTTGTVPDDRWAILLDPTWVPVLSKSVLGEPAEFGDAGTDDLVRELAAQAYAAVRTRFASAGGSTERSLPDTTFTLIPKGGALNPDDFPSDVVQFSFQLSESGQSLNGLALVPARHLSAAAAAAGEPAGATATDQGGATGSVDAADEVRDSDATTIQDPTRRPSAAATKTSPASDGPTGASSEPPPAASESAAAPSGQSPVSPSPSTVSPSPSTASSSPSPASSQARVEVAPAAFPELGREIIAGDGSDAGFSLLAEVDLEVTVELGRRKIQLADVLRLTTGSVIELEKLVGEPLEVYANGRLIAEGEAVVMDEQFGIRITNLTSNRPRAKAFT